MVVTLGSRGDGKFVKATRRHHKNTRDTGVKDVIIGLNGRDKGTQTWRLRVPIG